MDNLAPRLQRWLRQFPGYESSDVGEMRLVDGGASNITYRVDLSSGPYTAIALRLQRSEGIFQPYNVMKEADVLRKLAASPVPVPHVIGSELDPEVLGARFAVLEWIDAPHMGEAGADADFDAYTRMVATIHELDWRAYGLDFLGVPLNPENAILAELAPIARRIRAWELESEPVLRNALAVLQQRRPRDSELAFCQGDINVYNYLFRDRKVVGVVDWEQAHIGDRRSDVGQLLALSNLKGVPFGNVRDMPFLQAYEQVTGLTLDRMEYFRAMWFFHLAVIHFGWVRLNGTTPWYSLEHVSQLLEASLTELI